MKLGPFGFAVAETSADVIFLAVYFYQKILKSGIEYSIPMNGNGISRRVALKRIGGSTLAAGAATTGFVDQASVVQARTDDCRSTFRDGGHRTIDDYPYEWKDSTFCYFGDYSYGTPEAKRAWGMGVRADVHDWDDHGEMVITVQVIGNAAGRFTNDDYWTDCEDIERFKIIVTYPEHRDDDIHFRDDENWVTGHYYEEHEHDGTASDWAGAAWRSFGDNLIDTLNDTIGTSYEVGMSVYDFYKDAQEYSDSTDQKEYRWPYAQRDSDWGGVLEAESSAIFRVRLDDRSDEIELDLDFINDSVEYRNTGWSKSIKIKYPRCEYCRE